jgi:hypothetical protein
MLSLIALMLFAGMVGCSASDVKFDSYKEADQALMKGIVDGDVDMDTINSNFISGEYQLSESEFEALEKYSKMHLEDGMVDIQRDDNVTHIQEKPAEAFGTDMNIYWTYEDGTYKIKGIDVYKE